MKKILNLKLKISALGGSAFGGKKNKGMSYVELIVVLSIFSVMTSVVLFNYGEFQAKVDIKNLASDIALKVVEAQKAALSGKLSTQDFAPKPSYGVYFNISPSTSFIYFADFNNDKIYNEISLDTILITKNNSIERIDRCTSADCVSFAPITTPLSVTFKRPDSKANFTNPVGNDLIQNSSDYIRITIKSPKEAKALIKIYPSGRIQVN